MAHQALPGKDQESRPHDSETSKSAANTEQSMPHMLTTKSGTSRAVFEDYIKTLPNQGTGHTIAYPHLPWQSYVTNLTSAQAQEVATQSFIDHVGRITEDDGGA